MRKKMKRNILLTGFLLLATLVGNAQSFDIDLSRQSLGRPFRYSVKVPDGNYRVSPLPNMLLMLQRVSTAL